MEENNNKKDTQDVLMELPGTCFDCNFSDCEEDKLTCLVTGNQITGPFVGGRDKKCPLSDGCEMKIHFEDMKKGSGV